MIDQITPFFRTDLFMPHGHCYLWKPELVGLHILSDALIALAYYSIPLTLLYFVRRRSDLPFTWVFLLFSAFIVACGTTHLLEIWILWYPTIWLSGSMKLITAVISLTTAIVPVLIVPQMLALLSPAQLKLANAALQKEIADRKRIENEREQAELAVSRLAAIVESSGDAIVGESLDGTITSWNAGAERLFGYTAAEVIDRSISILIPPDHTDELSYVLERIKDGEIIESYETVRVRKDGQRIDIAATISPIKDAVGQVIGAAKIARNITARKQAEESLRRYERIVSATTDAITLLDLNYAYQSVNQAYLNWYGKQQDDVLGHPISDFLPLDLYETTVKPRLDQCLAGQVVQYEMWNHYPTLGSQFLSVTYAPYFDVNQTIAGVVVSLRNITRLKQAEEALQQKAQQLAQAFQSLQYTQAKLVQTEKMSSLGQLVAGVAHEINNPVSFISGNLTHAGAYSRALLNLLQLYQQHYPQPAPAIQAEVDATDLDFLKEDLPKLLTSMEVGAERIQTIVLALRNFSRMDEAEINAVNIHDGIDSTLMILQSRLKATAGHPEIQVLKDYGDLPRVECYAGQLNQVFMNILSNAIDALDEYDRQRSPQEQQQKPTSITIQTALVGEHSKTSPSPPHEIHIRIADNGPGMSEPVRQRLFEPFFTTKPIGVVF